MSSILIGYVIGDSKSGIDSYLLNLSKLLCDAGYEIDFLTNKKTDFMAEVCKERGIGLLEVPSLKNIPKQLNAMKDILHNKHYDIAYFNISEAFNLFGAIAAKQCKIEKIIVHSHNTSVGGKSFLKKGIRRILHIFFKHCILKSVATDYFACSKLAADWMFPRAIVQSGNYRVINNAIDTQKYSFDQKRREAKRCELNLTDEFVIGHISGFTTAKNVPFIVEIMAAMKEMDQNAHLLLVGEGEETEIVKQKIEEYGVADRITMLGRRTDVADLLQAMDAFLLPSLFEGAPIVAVEAQVSGLMTYLSDTVTTEVKLSDKCRYISLEKNPKEWAEIILENREYDREHSDFSRAEYCFDLEKQKEELINLFK